MCKGLEQALFNREDTRILAMRFLAYLEAIPIHTTPENEDLLLGTSHPCPKHDQLYNELIDSDQFRWFSAQYADFLKNISELTGFSPATFNNIYNIYSPIVIYRGFNLSLPAWTETYWPVIRELAAFLSQVDTYTPDMARLRVGPFFDYLLNYFGAVGDDALLPIEHVKGPAHLSEELADSNPPRFLMLSAHDTTIADRTNAMGVYPGDVPEFASTLIWELKSNSTRDLYVNMFFKNSTGLSDLTLPGCNFDCPLDEFASLLQPITATEDQWIKECNES